MSNRQVSIYSPIISDYWYTTILGEMQHAVRDSGLNWCWANAYQDYWTKDPAAHGVPESFKLAAPGGPALGQWLKLRYSADNMAGFEDSVRAVANKHGWYPHFEDFDLVDDLGQDRFIATEQLTAMTGPEDRVRRSQRAGVLVRFLHSGLLLTLDALVRDGAEWRFEVSTHGQNSYGPFHSMLHLVCNFMDANRRFDLPPHHEPITVTNGF
jgi:hypothetical protein